MSQEREAAAPPELSRFEANLLRILRFFFHRFPAERAMPLILNRVPRPTCLTRTAVRLVQDTLAKGCTLHLARGGWRRERHLRNGQRVEGRLWERTEPRELGLSFSRQSLDLLMWLTAENPSDPRTTWWTPDAAELTEGDCLLWYHAFAALRDKGLPRLATRLGFPGVALCRLAFPEGFATLTAEEMPAVSFERWTTGVGACVLEALQPSLAEHWLHVERDKQTVAAWQAMQGLGRSQEAATGAFLDAVEKAGRLDLARFLLRVLAALLTEGVAPQRWLASLQQAGPRLADRTATHRAALTLLHCLGRLRQWFLDARNVGYFEENYQASQLWKADWEQYQGELLWARAQAILRQVEPL